VSDRRGRDHPGPPHGGATGTPGAAGPAGAVPASLSLPHAPRPVDHPRPLVRSRAAPRLALTAVLVAVALLQLVSYPGRFDRDPPMLGPQENVRFELAQQWVREGEPRWALDAPAGLRDDAIRALTPRDAAVQDGAVVPKDFPNAIGLTALLMLIDRRLALALSAITGLALLAAAAALARRMGGRWSGVAAAVVLASTGAFTAGTSGPLNTGAAVALAVVGGVVLVLPAHGERGRGGAGGGPVRSSPRRDVLAGLAFGFGAGLHHDVVLLVAGLLPPLLMGFPGSIARAARIGGGASIALLPGLAYYGWLYGSPFSTGYSVGADALATPQESYFSLLALDPGMLVAHAGRYLARPEVAALLAGAVVASRCNRQPDVRRLSTGLLLGGIPYAVFMGARPLYGVDEFTVGGSFLRYCLPVVALVVCLCAAGLVAPHEGGQRAAAAALGAAAVIGTVVLCVSPGGLVDVHRQVTQNTHVRAAVLRATEPRAIIVTARGDKLLWPERTTIAAAYLVREPAEGIRYGSSMYDVVPSPQRLAEVVAGLVDAGQRVYVMSDSFPPYVGGLDVELGLAGVRREPTAVPSLFLITTASPSGN
jgi:hypothetical protein